MRTRADELAARLDLVHIIASQVLESNAGTPSALSHALITIRRLADLAPPSDSLPTPSLVTPPESNEEKKE